MTYSLPVGRERHTDVSAKLEICLAKLSGRHRERYAPRNRVVAVAAPPSCPYTRGSWSYEDEVRALERHQSGHRTGVDLQPTRTAGGLRRTPASPGSPLARQAVASVLGLERSDPAVRSGHLYLARGSRHRQRRGGARIHTAGTEVRGIRTAVSSAISKKEKAEAYKLEHRFTGPSSVPCRWARPRLDG